MNTCFSPSTASSVANLKAAHQLTLDLSAGAPQAAAAPKAEAPAAAAPSPPPAPASAPPSPPPTAFEPIPTTMPPVPPVPTHAMDAKPG